jgi:CRP/FNR family transcriptional regulator, cyclic AMP receptor protein
MESDRSFNLTLSPGNLRRLKVFADMTEPQVALFLDQVEPVQVKPNRAVVKMQEKGDCMYLVLEGQVRVSQLVDGKETVLATLETGDFFGEVCLFDEGLRSADVVANRDCTLLRITKTAFDTIVAEHPEVGVRFLSAMIRAVVARVRTMDKKYVDSMMLSRFWSPPGAPLGKASAASVPGSNRGCRA